ncbi:Putative NTF2-like domain superfamily protein [Septoria linicola]|uniref:NTF2-like domain superfamily protein n=1 Tax=Septoria linicola TaxID=215465 RepID=A0A9Q9AJK0_9PEZI|nr:putative NTF2-like domain superfamily protein [Septoria linicola]USW50524.1 Putative NTF2-like domain superfamily protein [Septoria linicola]
MDVFQPAKAPAGTTSLEDQLIQVTASYVSFVNAREWADAEDLQKHYHPAYRSECRFSTNLHTFLESINVMRELAETFPNFKVNVVEASANVDRSRMRALAFFHTNWTDAPPGLVTQVVHVVDWRFVDGQWLTFRSDILRGVDESV